MNSRARSVQRGEGDLVVAGATHKCFALSLRFTRGHLDQVVSASSWLSVITGGAPGEWDHRTSLKC